MTEIETVAACLKTSEGHLHSPSLDVDAAKRTARILQQTAVPLCRLSDALQRIAQLEADARRLDWLEKTQSSLYTCTHEELRATTQPFRHYEKVGVFDGFAVGMHADPRPTVREAVDAAMGGTDGEKPAAPVEKKL